MPSEDSEPLPTVVGESGDGSDGAGSVLPETAGEALRSNGTEGADEEALENHEVIELQAFSERKAWIEEKIQFLENLPSVEAFADSDLLPSLASDMPRLASRPQLEEWIAEHDRIEKETEIFDNGDLVKLKKFTKAATERNLSPEDTDLIELTLTTIYSLDKLLHLLRDRSENLNLLGLRLIWEEHRTGLWRDRHNIVGDLRSFLEKRARWSTAIYDAPSVSTDSIHSMQSFMSNGSTDDLLSTVPSGFSRSSRFKIAELLSRDAAQFSSRITGMRHGNLAASGRIIDKMIDESRHPVPDPILDEQDRLEDRCGKELENLGKFAMHVVMQWKKADEIYVETQKDIMSAEALIQELKSARRQHPTGKQDASFTSRLAILRKRLSVRQNPEQAKNSFPRPSHPLFQDQAESNTSLVELLGSQVHASLDLLKQAEGLLGDYHKVWEAVKSAEQTSGELTVASSSLLAITERLRYGSKTEAPDGLPPDLAECSCLQPIKYATYLAMLPSVLEDLREADESAGKVLAKAKLAAIPLRDTNVSEEFKTGFIKQIAHLDIQRKNANQSKSSTEAIVGSLREARRIWTVMENCGDGLEGMRAELAVNMRKRSWKQRFGNDGTPMTPESPSLDLPRQSFSAFPIGPTLDTLDARINGEVSRPLDALSPAIPQRLSSCLSRNLEDLLSALVEIQDLYHLWEDLHRQTSAMETLQEDVQTLENRIDELTAEADQCYSDILASSVGEDDVGTKDVVVRERLTVARGDLEGLNGDLATRIPFISRKIRLANPTHVISSDDMRIESLVRAFGRDFPFDASEADKAVRADSNAYSMRLAGCVKVVEQKIQSLLFARAVRGINRSRLAVLENIESANNEWEETKRKHGDLANLEAAACDDSVVDTMTKALEEISEFTVKQRSKIGCSASPVRTLASETRSKFRDDSRLMLSDSWRECESAINVMEQKIDLFFNDVDQFHTLLASAKDGGIAALQSRRSLDSHVGSVESEVHTAPEASSSPSSRAYDTANELSDVASDVFGEDIKERDEEEGTADTTRTKEMLTRVYALRSRLTVLNINGIARPRSPTMTSLPTPDAAKELRSQFGDIAMEAELLPSSSPDQVLDTELRSLRTDIDACEQLFQRIKQLVSLSGSVAVCDAALSTFLDHIDSYPDLPAETSSSYVIPDRLSAQDKLAARMSYTKGLVDDMNADFAAVADDQRAVAENTRLLQTWSELVEMASDHLNGPESRPVSSISSSRHSSVSTPVSSSSRGKKQASYGRLSERPAQSPARPDLLAPGLGRRGPSVSGSMHKRSPSNLSSVRSVSGPNQVTSRLFASTFASRQRTASLTSNASAAVRSPSRPPMLTERSRRDSSTARDSSRLRSPSVASSTRGTWSRAPRQSFGTALPSRATSPLIRRVQAGKRKYVANPQNKLDIAVGDVVNNLPVNINVEVVSDTWKDQSGKYWIGGDEPKLCFCRILRSQTVMVRVGGGWSELSKFIKDHFADLFRLLPESPPRDRVREERWINASTILEQKAAEGRTSGSPIPMPRTPERGTPSLPSVALHTPGGRSTRSMRSESSAGSPLMPLQFMRRADLSGASVRSPSRASSIRSGPGPKFPSPSKVNVWRP